MSRRRTKRYTQMSHLHGHSDGITAAVFSSAGTYLATGGLDGKVCIWDVDDGQLLHRHTGDSAVSAIAWTHSDKENELLFGTKGGNIARLTIAPKSLSVTGFWAHRHPVERLAIKDSWMASGALNELKIWTWDTTEEVYLCIKTLADPPKLRKNAHKDVIVTSLHWKTAEQHGLLLVVTYMHHGVYLYGAKDWHSVGTMAATGKIGDASLSPNGKYLVVSNLDSGFDVYGVEHGMPVCSFEHEAPEPDIIPVRFIHGGNAFVGGSSVGKLGVWDIYLKQKLFVLNIPKGAPVRAIDGHCRLASNRRDDRFFIATAVFNEGRDSPCLVWEARDIIEDSGEGTAEVLEDPMNMADSTLTHASSWMESICSLLVNIFVTAVCIVFLAYVFSAESL